MKAAHHMLGAAVILSREPEIKVEVTCLTERVKETLSAIRKIYLYEEPVINVIPLHMIGIERI